VLVRTGPDGCLIARPGDEVVAVPGFKVGAVDTNGAGDAHSGSFIAPLAAGAGGPPPAPPPHPRARAPGTPPPAADSRPPRSRLPPGGRPRRRPASIWPSSSPAPDRSLRAWRAAWPRG